MQSSFLSVHSRSTNGGDLTKVKVRKKKHKGKSVQQFIGLKAFTGNGIRVGKDELLFFSINPTNISVLSSANIEGKIRHMMMLLSAVPDIEISCTDSSECFDDNKLYLSDRLEEEQNLNIRRLIQKDMSFLDSVQTDISTARQFMLVVRIKGGKADKQATCADIERKLREEGFDFRHMKKSDIKRMLAIYFDASLYGEQMPDVDGAQFLEVKEREV